MLNAIKNQDWLYFVEPFLLPFLRLDHRVYNRYLSWRRAHYKKWMDKLTQSLIPLLEELGYDAVSIKIALKNGASETAYRKCKEIMECLKKST